MKLIQNEQIKGRTVSMTRLDQLAQPTRRNGEHIRAVIERQRQQQIESNNAFERTPSSSSARNMSRSLTHLASSTRQSSSAGPRLLHQFGSGGTPNKFAGNSMRPLPLRKSNTSKSMTQLVTAKLLSTPKSATQQHLPTVVRARNNAKAKQKSIETIEIDSRTTNVSVAGVCVCFIIYQFIFKRKKTFFYFLLKSPLPPFVVEFNYLNC